MQKKQTFKVMNEPVPQNKLECLSLASILRLVLYFRVSPFCGVPLWHYGATLKTNIGPVGTC